MSNITTIALVVASLLSGCVSTTIQEARQTTTEGLAAGESVVILGRKHKPDSETEKQFVECMTSETSKGAIGLNTISDQDFIDALYPWFEPRTAPLDVDDMIRLMNVPQIKNQLNSIGLRYIIWIDGDTKRTKSSGTLQCGVATGAMPACFGFVSWDAKANYDASIWDIKSRRVVGRMSSEAEGTSFIPAVILPLPFIARVQHQACVKLSDRLKVFVGE